jgi:hypothetical protein
MAYNKSNFTVRAGAALEAKRRVKINSGTVTDPPQVVYAGAGEDAIGVTEYAVASGDLVTLRPLNDPGLHEIEAVIASAIARGTVLYAGANGVVTDTATGSAVGVAFEAPAEDYQHIKVVAWSLKSTTAATVSVADSGSLITATTVEAALAEAFTHIQSIQHIIPIPLTSLRELTTNAIPASNTAQGILTADSTPALNTINGDTDGALRLSWVATNVDQVVFQVPLPPNLNTGANLVLHGRFSCPGTNTINVHMSSWFNEGDTKVADTIATAVTVATYTEGTITIAHADIPSGAQTLTAKIYPGTHAEDALYCTALWLEYKGTTLTS